MKNIPLKINKMRKIYLLSSGIKTLILNHDLIGHEIETRIAKHTLSDEQVAECLILTHLDEIVIGSRTKANDIEIVVAIVGVHLIAIVGGKHVQALTLGTAQLELGAVAANRLQDGIAKVVGVVAHEWLRHVDARVVAASVREVVFEERLPGESAVGVGNTLGIGWRFC